MPRRRSSEDSQQAFVDMLPHYIATRSSDFPAWLIIECPREECGHTFLVHRKNWFFANDKLGRSCPYCFMTSRLPLPKNIKRAA